SVTPGKVAPTLAVLINLLSCLRRDADLKEVVGAIKSDPVVQYNLVRYLDRAHLGFDYKFTTFEQAVMVVGYRTLEKWLATFLLWSNVKHFMPELCLLALTRGRQMELVTQRQGMDETTCGLAYITGVFSALPGILGIPLEAALKPLRPDDIIVTTLTERAGPLAPSLHYALATEGGPAKVLAQNLQQVGVSARDANHVMVESMLFAERQVTQ
ncbi:MAG: HDOD domain-containing protein, partial [Propionivibrio sp.]